MTRAIVGQISWGFQTSIFVPILYGLLTSIGITLLRWRNADIASDARLPSGNEQPYDFIIVGAGSAGCVLANRLSRHFNVLLLEAGGEPHPLQNVPALGFFFLNYPEVDWGHLTVPQHGGSLNSMNQQSSWSAGIGLGGTGTLNLMLHLRGSPMDYDNWAKITGDPSWRYEAVLPYFKRYEKYGDLNGDPHYHGFNGEMNIELPSYTGIADEFLQAGQELGYPNIDINARHTEGFFKIYHTTERGVRDSPYRAFLKPIRNRKSITIRKYAYVSKVLFREGDQEVDGVEYVRHGKTERVYATKEVIISAGAITTPKLLMLSGIGPKEHLDEVGIPVKHNLPVGKNLQDHLAVYLGPFFLNSGKSILFTRDFTPGQFLSWSTKGGGPLSTSGTVAAGVVASEFAKARGEKDWADLNFFLFGYSLFATLYKHSAKAFSLKEDEMRRYYEHAVGKDSVHVVISGARPISRGFIKLGGTSFNDAPIIDPNYLNDPDDIDVRVLLEGVHKSLNMFENTTTMQGIGAKFTTELLPGCEHLPFRTDAYWLCYIRRYTVTIHHPCGTAAMGPRGSPDAVVDSELRVQGVKNLRVIDASVMPQIVVTNTQAGSIMIGEKGADLILKHWSH